MKISSTDGNRERKILTAMITDAKVLSSIVPKWEEPGLFASRTGNLLGGFCVNHYKQYSKAPGRGIVSILEDWASDGPKDKDTIQKCETILEGLSSEYEREDPPDSAFITDLAGRYFNHVQLTKLADSIKDDLEAGKVNKAQSRLVSHSKIELGIGSGVDLLNDEEAVKSTFDRKSKEEDLIPYGGALGVFFTNVLERERFVVFSAPQKIGKTWWLLDVAWRAATHRKRVAFFEVGDLSQNQVNERFLVRGSAWPARSRDGRWPTTLRVPKKIIASGDDISSIVEFEDREFNKPLDKDKAWESCKRVTQSRIKSDESYLKISCHPNLSISILGIKSILEGWAKNGWVCDVLVLDYLDNLAPVDKKEETRDRVNTTWKLAKALNNEMHCCLVAATQVNAAGFRVKWLERHHFSEDNRKLSHVDVMVGINCYGDEEKGNQVVRLNKIVQREGEFSTRSGVYVAGCLGIAHPSMKSCFKEK